MSYTKFTFLKSESPKSKEVFEILTSKYGNYDIQESDVIVPLGGDGFLLETLHKTAGLETPIFGINCGTLGFLLNEYKHDADLIERMKISKEVFMNPISAEIRDVEGNVFHHDAYNEVSLIRYSGQSANLKIEVDDRTTLEELRADGILVCTPAGSTAYNFSANGPIIPLESSLLGLTPISPFRPRRWKGALLPDDVVIRISNLDVVKRPVSAAADSAEITRVKEMKIWVDQSKKRRLLFDKEESLEERLLAEQFKH